MHALWLRIQAYGQLIRIHQPVGLWLLGFPALWALWLAGHGHPSEPVLIVFLAGGFLTRSAGCAINDFADRKVDPFVKRTQDRPLARGALRPIEAILVFTILNLLAFCLVLNLNVQTIRLSVVGAALMIIYPFLKRVFSIPQAWLGVAFTWSIPMAYSALDQSLDFRVWILFAAGVLWTLVYDTEYAMVDRDDDQHLPVRSSALLFGRYDRQIILGFQLGMVALLTLFGLASGLGFWYYTGLGAAVLLMAYQQWLIRARERAGCFAAFRNNAWVGLVIFLGIAMDQWYPH